MNRKIIVLTFVFSLMHHRSQASAALTTDQSQQIITLNVQKIYQSTSDLAAFAKQQHASQKKELLELEQRKKELAQAQNQMQKIRDDIAKAQAAKDAAIKRASLNSEKKLLVEEFEWRYEILRRLNRIYDYNESDINRIVGELLQRYNGPQLEAFKAFLIRIEKSALLPKPIK